MFKTKSTFLKAARDDSGLTFETQFVAELL